MNRSEDIHGSTAADPIRSACPRAAAAAVESRRFIRNLFFANLPLPVLKLRTYLWLVVFASALGAEGYGVWSLFTVTLGVLFGPTSLNLGSAMARFLSADATPDQINRAWSTVLTAVVTAALAVGAAVIALPAAWSRAVFGGVDGWFAVSVASALLTDLVFELVRSYFRARRQNDVGAYLCLTRFAADTAVTLAVGLATGSIRAAIAAYAACSAIAAVGACAYLRLRWGVRFVRPSLAVFRRYAAFGVALLPGGLAYALALNADRYVVGANLDLAAVGVYSAAVTIAGLVFFLVGPMNDVLVPELARLYDASDQATFRSRFSSMQKFVLGLSSLFAAVLCAMPDEVMFLFTAGRITGGGPPLAVLAIQGLCMAVLLLYITVLNVHLRARTSSAIWVAVAAGLLAGDLVLVPRYGITGAAIGSLAATAGGLAAATWLTRPLARETFRALWLAQLAAAIGLTFATAVAWPAAAPTYGGAALKLTAAAAAYAAGLFATGFATGRELRYLTGAFAPAR